MSDPTVIDKRPTYDTTPLGPFTAQALGEHVIVRRDDIRTISDGGIVLADVAQEKPLSCEVLSVGAKAIETIGDTLTIGDRVMIPRHAGTEMEIQGHTVTSISALDIIVRL